jgi:hypothetical protein
LIGFLAGRTALEEQCFVGGDVGADFLDGH